MDMQMIETFLMWCTIINGGLFVFSAIFLTFGGGFVYRFHGDLFNISREAFNVVIYSFLGIYKIFFITFNIVPYLALRIMA